MQVVVNNRLYIDTRSDKGDKLYFEFLDAVERYLDNDNISYLDPEHFDIDDEFMKDYPYYEGPGLYDGDGNLLLEYTTNPDKMYVDYDGDTFELKDDSWVDPEIACRNYLEKMFENNGWYYEKHTAQTGTTYYTVENVFKIRLADHSDAYADSDINVNIIDGDNDDGIEISEVEKELKDLIASQNFQEENSGVEETDDDVKEMKYTKKDFENELYRLYDYIIRKYRYLKPQVKRVSDFTGVITLSNGKLIRFSSEMPNPSENINYDYNVHVRNVIDNNNVSDDSIPFNKFMKKYVHKGKLK